MTNQEPSEKDLFEAGSFVEVLDEFDGECMQRLAERFAELRAEKEEAVKEAEQRAYAECKKIAEDTPGYKLATMFDASECGCGGSIADQIQEAAERSKGEG